MKAHRILPFLACVSGVFAYGTLGAEPRLSRFAMPGLVACWILSAAAHAIPYGRRYGARRLDYALLTAQLCVLLLLPLVPLAWGGFDRMGAVWPTLVYGIAFNVIVAAHLGQQGFYAGSDRSIPELSGEPRAVADAILAEAGLRPASVLVARLPVFGAMVFGLRSCVVLLDRRAADSLSAAELRAMLAHEAAHVRQGGAFWYLFLVPAAMTAANAAVAVHAAPALAMLSFAATYFCVGAALKQTLELAADRFAVRLCGASDLARMLDKVHGDMPSALRRITESVLFFPLQSHPPLAARLAAVGAGEHGALARNRAARLLVPTVFLLLPWVARFTVPLPVGTWLAWGLLALLVLATGLAWWRFQRAALRSFAIQLGRSPHATGRQLAVLAVIVALLALLLADLAGHPLVKFPWRGAVWLVLLLAALLALRFRPVRSDLSSRSATVRKAVIGALAALGEGRPEEGLTLVDGLLQSQPRDPWLLTARGACLVHLGEHERAIADLRAALDGQRDLPLAMYTLAAAEFLSGRLEEARASAEEITRAVPGDPQGWELRGMISLELGKLQEADEWYARAGRLKSDNARALAGRALAAFEGARFDGEPERWVARAREIEPRAVLVLMAAARQAQHRGLAAEAQSLFAQAMQQLRREGARGWAPYYMSLAGRWGILTPLSPGQSAAGAPP